MEGASGDVLKGMDEKVLQWLEHIDDLPTIPLVIGKIEQAASDPNSTARDVAAIIEDDPSIMARVLRMVNSVFYRPVGGREVTSLPLAIARLGFKTVKNIALTTAVFTVLGDRKTACFDVRKFWEHCITTGIICNVVYEECAGNLRSIYTRDELHLIGLLHDVGKIILEYYFRDHFARALELSMEKQQHLLVSEEEILGVNHAQVGAWLAHRWSLPALFQYGIRYHHDPASTPEDFYDMAALTHLADFICLKGGFGYSGSSSLPPFDRVVWKRLGLNNDKLSTILDRTREEAKMSSVLLSALSTN